MTHDVGTFIAVYLTVGFLIGFALFGWLAVSSVRRHGFRKADTIKRCLDAELAFYAIEVFKIGLRF